MRESDDLTLRPASLSRFVEMPLLQFLFRHRQCALAAGTLTMEGVRQTETERMIEDAESGEDDMRRDPDYEPKGPKGKKRGLLPIYQQDRGPPLPDKEDEPYANLSPRREEDVVKVAAELSAACDEAEEVFGPDPVYPRGRSVPTTPPGARPMPLHLSQEVSSPAAIPRTPQAHVTWRLASCAATWHPRPRPSAAPVNRSLS